MVSVQVILQKDHRYGLLMDKKNPFYFISKRDLKGAQILYNWNVYLSLE
jgi:hypothetical protein